MCQSDALLSATQVRLAVAAYVAEQGDLPSTIEALVPDYLDAIPVDPFDGKAIRYDRDRAWVYSIASEQEPQIATNWGGVWVWERWELARAGD